MTTKTILIPAEICVTIAMGHNSNISKEQIEMVCPKFNQKQCYYTTLKFALVRKLIKYTQGVFKR